MSKRVILKIGNLQVLLPNDTGAAVALKALSRGVPVYHFGGPEVDVRDEELSVSLTYLNASHIVKNKKPAVTNATPKKKAQQP